MTWRSFWRSIDRFSLQHFKTIIDELRAINIVDRRNREVVLDLMQSIVEIVTYGDRHDPSIFECFMEFQVLAEFIRILIIGGSSGIQAPVLQYLSIMIQNMDNEHAIYYSFSNGYINSIITHEFQFEGGDLVPYYVSFLRAVSGKIDRDSICLLVKVEQDTVVSFPLYVEALKFADHTEKMIQIAVRAITLNIYNVADDMVYQFLTTPPVSGYFSDLVLNLRRKCIQVDALVNGTKETFQERKRELLHEIDRIVDDLYYLKDVLSIGEQRLTELVTQDLVNILILPVLLPLLQVSRSSDTCLSAVTSLYVLCRLLQVFDGTNLAKFVSSTLPFLLMPLSATDAATSVEPIDLNQANALAVLYHEAEEIIHLLYKGEEEFMKNHLLEHSFESMESSYVANLPLEITQSKWGGLLHYLVSGNHSLMLASLMLLFVVAESKDVHHQLAAIVSQTKNATDNGSIPARNVKEILDALLKVLANESPYPVPILLHTAWALRKLLSFLKKKPDDYDCNLFKTSYELSYGRLREEFSRCWFDHIPGTLRNEWTTCKTALEESSQFKDPVFVLELAMNKVSPSGITTSGLDWQVMVDTVKVFILHLQLKPFIFGGDPFDNPFVNLKNSSLAVSGRRYASDLSSAGFGSEVAIGSGIPCKIAFSGAGTRDIYVIPIAQEMSGKLLLIEQHPLHSRRGVVIAVAPLAGLNPKIDENHLTWLHLQLRELEPRFDTSEARNPSSNTSFPAVKGKWILGFTSAEVCNTAYTVIVEETRKQSSFVESLVGTLVQSNCCGNLLTNQ